MAGRTRRTNKAGATSTPAAPAAATTTTPSGFAGAPVAGGFGQTTAPAVPAGGFASPATPAAAAGFGGAVTPPPAASGFGGAPMTAAVQAAHPTPAAPAAPQQDAALSSAVSDVLSNQAAHTKTLTTLHNLLKELVKKVESIEKQLEEEGNAAEAAPVAAVSTPGATGAAQVTGAASSAPQQDASAAYARAVTAVRDAAKGYYESTANAAPLNINTPEHLLMMAQVLSTSGVPEVVGDPTDAGYQANTAALLQQGGATDANGVLLGSN